MQTMHKCTQIADKYRYTWASAKKNAAVYNTSFNMVEGGIFTKAIYFVLNLSLFIVEFVAFTSLFLASFFPYFGNR